MLYIVKCNAMQRRIDSFSQPVIQNGSRHECTYLQSPEFIQELAKNGFTFYPINGVYGQIVDLVQCTWCGTTLGPFQDPVDIRSLHSAGHAEGPPKVSCPFI